MDKEYLEEQLALVKEREILLKEMIDEEKACQRYVEGIIGAINSLRQDSSITLLEGKDKPVKISLFGFDFNLELNGRNAAYDSFGKDYWITIGYTKSRRIYEIAISPKYKSCNIYDHDGLTSHMWFVRRFEIVK